MKGSVKFFNDEKGFGFIKAEDEKEYFFHITGVKGGIHLSEGDNVTFDVEDGQRGKKAVNVELVDSENKEEDVSAQEVKEA